MVSVTEEKSLFQPENVYPGRVLSAGAVAAVPTATLSIEIIEPSKSLNVTTKTICSRFSKAEDNCCSALSTTDCRVSANSRATAFAFVKESCKIPQEASE